MLKLNSKTLIFLSFTALLLALSPCAEAAEVQFNDATLEAAVRNMLSIPTNPVTDADMTGLSWMFLSGVNDFTGLEYAVNITDMEMINGSVSDISALSAMTSMGYLTLSNNSISNISALSSMGSLEWLDLANNSVSDVSVLSNMPDLENLYLENNLISDISSLSGNTVLRELWLGDNSVSDISVLANIASLDTIELIDNNVADISPLTSLTGLSYLDLTGNPLDEASRLQHLTTIAANNPGIELIYTPFVENPPPGDANLDGSVDLLDLNILRENYRTVSGATVYDGDFDEDGDVDFYDFLIFNNNFGLTATPPSPEPASMLILAAGALVITRRRRDF